MMKVLHVVIDNNIGGIQNRLLQIVELLKKKDIESIILTPTTTGQFSKTAREKGINVYQACIQSPKLNNSTKNILKNFFWFVKFPLGLIQTIRIIKREKIQIVHANGLFALHAVIAGLILDRKICWHLVSTIYPTSHVKLLRPLFFMSGVYCVLITHNTIDYYFGSKHDSARFRIIFEPVDLQYFNRSLQITETGKSVLKQYHIGDNTQLIGFIGNITPQKGLEYFVKTAYEVKKKYSGNLKFLIIGETTKGHEKYFSKLLRLIKDLDLQEDFLFTGKVSDLRPVLSNIDIFLMTSVSEGTPIVILEAMAMKIPVIAPDVGGISDQITNGTTGLVVSPKNTESISGAVLFLLENPNIRLDMGKKGREKVEKQFSLETCVSDHHKLYNEFFYELIDNTNKN